jgi:flagellar protein FlbT
MANTLRISLKTGERIFINGALLRAGRKATLELLNTASFLLEQHIMDPEGATTPLRKLYLEVQSAVMAPERRASARSACIAQLDELRRTPSREVATALPAIAALIERERFIDALKLIRGLFPHDAAAA